MGAGKVERNRKVLQMAAAGKRNADIARTFGITPARVRQIIRKYGGRQEYLTTDMKPGRDYLTRD